MTTQNLLPLPELQFFDNNGQTLAAGLVYTFDGDGVTPKSTYQDSAGTILNTNPIALDGSGRAVILGTGVYVWRVTDSLGNILYTHYTADPLAALNISPVILPFLASSTIPIALAYLGGAPLDSPSFIGTPTTPTPASGNNSTLIATTAFVQSAIAGFAPINSPTFTGVPAGPTAAPGTNTTQLATTAFVTAAIAAALSGGAAFGVVQDVTASRTAGTTYTNSTGKPMYVFAAFNGWSDVSNTGQLTVNGQNFLGPLMPANTGYATVCAMVPPSGTYSGTAITSGSMTGFPPSTFRWLEVS